MKSTIYRLVLAGLLTPLVGCLSMPSPAKMVGLGDNLPPNREGTLAPRESAEICVNLANDLERNNYLADAVVQLEKARQIDPKAKNVSRRLAVLYDRIGDEKKAVAEFELALKAAPNDADLLNDFGYCHYNRGRWAESESLFRKAVAANAEHPRAWNNLGMSLAQQSKPDEALQAFAKTCKPAEAKSNLAFVAAARGQRAEAIRLYREALTLDSNLRTARQALATLEGEATSNTGVVRPTTFTRPGGDKEKMTPSEARIALMRGSAAVDQPPVDESPVTVGPRRCVGPTCNQ